MQVSKHQWSSSKKICSIMHLLSHHLLAQSHQQKHLMNVQDLLKVNNKKKQNKVNDVILVSLRLTLNTFQMMLWCFECFCCWLSTCKISIGSKSHRYKKRWYNFFVVQKKHWFIVVRGKLRPHLKWCFFVKTVYSR